MPLDFPVEFGVGAVRVPAHLVFEVAAFFAGGRLYLALGRRQADPIPVGRRLVLILAAAVGALVGSRALAALEHRDAFAVADGVELLVLLAGLKTIVGGLLGGLVAVEVAKALLGERRRSGDRFVYPLLLAIAVGRIGCALAGVADGTAGVVTDLPWAYDQGDGLSRHPTAVYEILVLGGLALGLRAAERRRTLRQGELFALFLSGYLAWRLGAEFLKPVEPLALGLSAIQWACVLGLAHYARLFAQRRFAPAELARLGTEAEQAAPQPPPG